MLAAADPALYASPAGAAAALARQSTTQPAVPHQRKATRFGGSLSARPSVTLMTLATKLCSILSKSLVPAMALAAHRCVCDRTQCQLAEHGFEDTLQAVERFRSMRGVC